MIGGGDWAADRIIPDTVRSLRAGEPITLRNPDAISWDFATTTARTLQWYLRVVEAGEDPRACCLDDLSAYLASPALGRSTR
ncbi:hypothetical protein [Synechococcus sp. CCY 9618]|uniref:hypothetical protein n=1 Tax=Synechococcus sp. CCY 9618 TaxID=2815602 RepID=UPI001C225F99